MNNQSIILDDPAQEIQFIRVDALTVEDYTRNMIARLIYATLFVLLLTSCGSPPPADDSGPSEAVSRLSFEERMAIRARLTVIRSDSKTEAKEIHDPFRSKEDAVAYEKLVAEKEYAKRALLQQEYGLTDADLEFIVNEYLESQGVGLREQ